MLRYDSYLLGEYIRQCREGHGLSGLKLAEKIGVSKAAVSQWESGNKTVDLKYLMLLADLFGVSLDDMVSGKYCKYHDMIRQYDFESDFYVDGKLDRKKLKTKAKKESFIRKYDAGYNKMEDMIRDLFLEKEIYTDLLRSFLTIFDMQYQGKALTVEMIQNVAKKTECDSFLQQIRPKRDMQTMIFTFIENDVDLLYDYVRTKSEKVKDRMLQTAMEQKENDLIVMTLLHCGAFLRTASGERDAVGTMNLMRRLMGKAVIRLS